MGPSADLIESALNSLPGHSGSVQNVRRVGGGCINECFELAFSEVSYFLKQNSASAYPGMFEAEYQGLKQLADANAIRVPRPIGFGEHEDNSWLLMEFLESSARKLNFWERFGQQLASLHKQHAAEFGLPYSNYIGSLPQFNEKDKSWTGFFRTQRLEPQIKMARDSGMIDRSVLSSFERFFDRSNELFPDEKPSLIHGDLWSGNYITGPDGFAAIVDPAIAFSNREADLAMSKLFGGFASGFYKAYDEAYPMEAGWEQRMDLYNLYPLMVHVNLFGRSYLSSVQSILRRFS